MHVDAPMYGLGMDVPVNVVELYIRVVVVTKIVGVLVRNVNVHVVVKFLQILLTGFSIKTLNELI